MADIFLSYSHEDSDHAEQLYSSLMSNNLTVWMDINLTVGTSQWNNTIEQEILGATCVVVLLSPNSRTSPWVAKELSYAEMHNVKVFPILISGERKDAVPIILATHQYADARTSFQTGVKQLTCDVRKYLRLRGVFPPSMPEEQVGLDYIEYGKYWDRYNSVFASDYYDLSFSPGMQGNTKMLLNTCQMNWRLRTHHQTSVALVRMNPKYFVLSQFHVRREGDFARYLGHKPLTDRYFNQTRFSLVREDNLGNYIQKGLSYLFSMLDGESDKNYSLRPYFQHGIITEVKVPLYKVGDGLLEDSTTDPLLLALQSMEPDKRHIVNEIANATVDYHRLGVRLGWNASPSDKLLLAQTVQTLVLDKLGVITFSLDDVYENPNIRLCFLKNESPVLVDASTCELVEL